MAVTLTVNGTAYSYPNTGDQSWGDNATNWATAVTSGMLQKAGGTFTLTADVNFGASFGLLAPYFTSITASPATAGVLRLARTDSINWLNAAGNANLPLGVDSSNNLTYNGNILSNSSGVIPVASGGTSFSSYTAGDMLYASGTTAFSKLGIGSSNKVLTSNGSVPSWNTLVNANIDAAAAIAYSKLATLNTGQILAGNAGTPTATTLGGDATVGATGTLTIAALAVTAAKMSSGAASSGAVATADGSGNVSYASPASSPTQSYEINNLGLSVTVAANALTIALKQSDGSTDPSSGVAAVKASFRSATAATGSYTERSITAALSVVVPSTTTIGTANGVTTYLYVYFIDNAGTVVLGVSMNLFDDGTIQSSSAVSGGASATTLYSTSAQTSKAIRLIGRIKISEATAGTWATGPTEVSLFPFKASFIPTVQTLTSGSGTYTTPTSPRPAWIEVELVGGGGGGAGSGTSAGTAATDGTASTFGTSLLSAGGGTHGVINVNGGAGGTSSLGTGPVGIALTGGTGGPGVGQGTVPTSSIPGGSGGNSALGGGGSGGSSGIGAGAAGAANTGGGGGGGVAGTTTNVQSGAGGGGGGFIRAIIVNPADSYPWSCGVGGTAGGAGASGFAGAAGGGGVIVVRENYR